MSSLEGDRSAQSRYNFPRKLAQVFLSQIQLHQLGLTPPDLKILNITEPEDSKAPLQKGKLHVWEMIHEDPRGLLCTTTLKRSEGSTVDPNTFFSLSFSNPEGWINYDKQGNETKGVREAVE